MKNRWNILVAAALLIIAGACSSDTEKRIANLERRVNALENKGITRSSTTPVQTVDNKTSNSVKTNTVESPIKTGNAAFKWEKPSFNFGTIKEGDIIEHTFKFTNVGTEPLLIKKASASCGCTVPQYTKEAILPGGKGEIKVKFNSKGKSGQQSPVITIVANTTPKQTRLSLRGVVEKKNS